MWQASIPTSAGSRWENNRSTSALSLSAGNAKLYEYDIPIPAAFQAKAAGADVVGGPVLPEFDDDAKRWLGRHPAFRPAYDASGPVPVIYGCGNCLITRTVFEKLANPIFDLRFNFLGGGDCDFFWRCRLAGMHFHWVEEAIITETVPQSRTNLGWIVWRGLRIGAINYHVQLKAAPTMWSRVTLRLLALTVGHGESLW